MTHPEGGEGGGSRYCRTVLPLKVMLDVGAQSKRPTACAREQDTVRASQRVKLDGRYKKTFVYTYKGPHDVCLKIEYCVAHKTSIARTVGK
jgi:hypothetical protein